MKITIGLIVVVVIISIFVVIWLKSKKTAEVTLRPMNEQQLIHWVRVELNGNGHVTNKEEAIAHLQQQGATVATIGNMFVVTLH